jgi:hypothetical protein
MDYTKKTTSAGALTVTGFAVWKSWLIAAIIITLAFGVILWRHKSRRIK